MKRTLLNCLMMISIFFSLPAFSKGKFIELKWENFRDYNEKTKTPGKKIKEFIGKDVAIVGFMMPLDYSAKKVKEFLLLPYIPSCEHVPPPPAHQVIQVKMDKNAIKPSYYPVKLKGKLSLAERKKGKADPMIPQGVYSMEGIFVEEMKY